MIQIVKKFIQHNNNAIFDHFDWRIIKPEFRPDLINLQTEFSLLIAKTDSFNPSNNIIQFYLYSDSQMN